MTKTCQIALKISKLVSPLGQRPSRPWRWTGNAERDHKKYFILVKYRRVLKYSTNRHRTVSMAPLFLLFCVRIFFVAFAGLGTNPALTQKNAGF